MLPIAATAMKPHRKPNLAAIRPRRMMIVTPIAFAPFYNADQPA
jgi:hypothetical protein